MNEQVFILPGPCFCGLTRKHDSVLHDRALAVRGEYSASETRVHELIASFDWEFLALSHEERELLIRDSREAFYDDDCSVAQYAGRIGRGNLASYVACLKAGRA